MVTVGPAVDGMIASSRRRLLAHLGAGHADEAALEVETSLEPALHVAPGPLVSDSFTK